MYYDDFSKIFVISKNVYKKYRKYEFKINWSVF